MNKFAKIGLLIISLAAICLIIISVTKNPYNPFLIGPKGDDFPFLSLSFRGLNYEGKEVTSWERISWNFLEPQKYDHKFSVRIPGKNIEASSFSYGGDYLVSYNAFQGYESLLKKNEYNKVDFHAAIESGKFVILNSSSFENNNFVYVELIKTLSDTYYIIVIKSSINEKEIVKTIAQETTPLRGMTIDEARQQVNFTLAVPEYLPPGYSFDKITVLKFDETQSITITYTNGDEMLTVYESNSAGFNPENKFETIAVNNIEFRYIETAFDRSLFWTQKGVEITAHGSISKEVLIRMAESMN